MNRCQRLSQYGRRCKRKAKWFVTMCQPSEMYDTEPNWCILAVCNRHAGTKTYKITTKDMPLENTEEAKKEEEAGRE